MPKGVAANSRSRGPYTTHACTICRVKKSKCDGVKPVCSACALAGRDLECSWERDSAARKPRTDAHFEALQQRANALEAYANRIEAILAKCICQDVLSHLQFRPREQEDFAPRDESDDELSRHDSDDELIRELTIPMQRLKLDPNLGGGLLFNGGTGPTRTIVPPAEKIPSVEVADENSNTYVLLVEGVDEADAHPEIDWSRNLPSDIAISRRDHDRVLYLAFGFWTGSGFQVVPSLFLKDMYRALSTPRSQSPPKTPSYSAMLHNALLAVCATLSENAYLQDQKTRLRFATMAENNLRIEYQHPHVSLVHALILLCTFYVDSGDQILGDFFSGMSMRASLSLGLGVDCEPWFKSGFITWDEMLGRNWAAWQLFHFDVRWSLWLGCEFSGPSKDGRPLPFLDAAADQVLWTYAGSNVPPQPNLLTLILRETSALTLIGRKIIDVVNTLSETQPSSIQIDQLVTKIDVDLYNWKSHLSPELDITPANRNKSTPYRLMLHCEYWSFFIALHRPFFGLGRKTQLGHNTDQVDHVKLCKRAAENLLELFETWCTLYASMRLAPPTMVQIFFSAGTVFVLFALQATASSRIAHSALQTALQQVDQCIRYLDELGRTWACALPVRDTLRSIVQTQLHPVLTHRLAQKGVRLTTILPPGATPVLPTSTLVDTTGSSKLEVDQERETNLESMLDSNNRLPKRSWFSIVLAGHPPISPFSS